MEIKADRDFAEWAVSYSGIDGGNISGSTWFCGIENGGEQKEGSLIFTPQTLPPYVDHDVRKNFKNFQYNWKMLKLYSTILGFSAKEYKKTYQDTRTFDQGSDTFKMNLYPIGFKNESDGLWSEWMFKTTGFPSKPLYQAWCQLNRFPAIKSWVESNDPKMIICTGSTYLREFLMAFSGYEHLFADINESKLTKGSLFWRVINDGKTILFITPFLGQGGLKSDAQIEECGLEIKSISEQCFNQST